MIDKLIQASLNNRGIVIALTLVLLIWGSYVALNTKVDVFPDLTAPTVTILVEGRGMVPTEMESLITFPIEASMNGASGVRRVRSATAVGVAIIWVEFDWDVDIHRARQVVAEKLALTAGALPAVQGVVVVPEPVLVRRAEGLGPDADPEVARCPQDARPVDADARQSEAVGQHQRLPDGLWP